MLCVFSMSIFKSSSFVLIFGSFFELAFFNTYFFPLLWAQSSENSIICMLGLLCVSSMSVTFSLSPFISSISFLICKICLLLSHSFSQIFISAVIIFCYNFKLFPGFHHFISQFFLILTYSFHPFSTIFLMLLLCFAIGYSFDLDLEHIFLVCLHYAERCHSIPFHSFSYNNFICNSALLLFG